MLVDYRKDKEESSLNELYTAYLVKYNEYCKNTEHPMDEDAWIAAQWFLDNL